MQEELPLEFSGLNEEQVLASRLQHGKNLLQFKKENKILDAIKSIAKEPMILLLLAAAVLYFVSGETGDGVFMAAAIILVAVISLYQDARSRGALEKLKQYAKPDCTLIRDNKKIKLPSEEIVLGDYLLAEEGSSIPADGTIVQSNDFSVNESILTGEAFSVPKDKDAPDPQVYLGTNVVSGLAVVKITAIGNQTKLGKIGKSLEDIKSEKTPLELKINDFVKKMVIAGAIVFLIVWGINFLKSHDLLDSLLKALTLAMSILPEEIPVAFTTFMALGAWRLMKMGIVVKQMKTVETLGSATVICIDKTGTITQNQMSVSALYVQGESEPFTPQDALNKERLNLMATAMWASEPIPFDPMEIALHSVYKKVAENDLRSSYTMIHEYPLGGTPPMMTHIYKAKTGEQIITAKGAPEAFLKICDFTKEQKLEVTNMLDRFTKKGFRVLGVADAVSDEKSFPENQQDFAFRFLGLVAFYDPPKENIANVLQDFYKAGIDVKIITGDNTETTAAIATEIGLKGRENQITGEELMLMEEATLQEKVMEVHIFSRMYPEAKLRIINALKAKGQLVAMTGDGVNDGPALKAAHIGIAMGKRGTETARQAASIILVEDDLSQMVNAIAMGRKIFTNLKKAIQYIISIHIPIILTVFIPLALGWIYPNIFTPLHIIFMELVMGPTCSIIYENEPMEKNTMLQPPKEISNSFFVWRELTTSILQGLVITAGTLFAYRYAISMGYNEDTTRTMTFTTLIFANIFLTLVNRSFYYSIFTTIGYKNNLVGLIILVTLITVGLLLYVPAFASFFQFEALFMDQLLFCGITGMVSVLWYEAVKWIKRMRAQPTGTLIGSAG